MFFQTERLVERKFNANDWLDLHEYLSQKEVLKYEAGDVSDVEECKEMAHQIMAII